MKIFKQSLLAAGLLALAAGPALAYEPGTFVLRGGVGTVDPKSTNFSITEDFGAGPETVIIDVRNSSNMTLTGTYMFNQNWALDILAAMPFKHDIRATLTTPIPDSEDFATESLKIAETKQIPPTISLQYHFSPDGDFQPYAGIGFNWTSFSSTKFVPELADLLEEEIDKLIVEDSYGLAAQIGLDWAVGDRVVVNLDVRWIDIDSDVSVTSPAFSGKEKLFRAEIDPWIYSLNLGYHF